MTPDTIEMIRRILPQEMQFPYYPDRESAWVLAQHLQGETPVAALRAQPHGKLLDRSLVKPLVAACGGRLNPRDVLPLAHADRAIRWPDLSPAARRALDPVFANAWLDFTLSFDAWGIGRAWQHQQVSRKGGNLVIQLGFPSEHARVFGAQFDRNKRRKLEYTGHPVRLDGPPTLAWARVDLDLDTGTALIEELQTDWLRAVGWEKLRMAREGAQDRELKVMIAYEQALIARYARIWPKVMLLATLYLLREEFAVRQVWMHQPEAGQALKSILGRAPPRSLYTSLPRAFCMVSTDDWPPFLRLKHHRALAKVRASGHPLFWTMVF